MPRSGDSDGEAPRARRRPARRARSASRLGQSTAARPPARRASTSRIDGQHDAGRRRPEGQEGRSRREVRPVAEAARSPRTAVADSAEEGNRRKRRRSSASCRPPPCRLLLGKAQLRHAASGRCSCCLARCALTGSQAVRTRCSGTSPSDRPARPWWRRASGTCPPTTWRAPGSAGRQRRRSSSGPNTTS